MEKGVRNIISYEWGTSTLVRASTATVFTPQRPHLEIRKVGVAAIDDND